MVVPPLTYFNMAAGSPGFANGMSSPAALVKALTVPDDIFAGIPVQTPTASSRQVSQSLLGWAPHNSAWHGAAIVLEPNVSAAMEHAVRKGSERK